MGLLSEAVKNIEYSGIREFFDLVRTEDKDIISFGVGEPDFTTPWHIRKKGIYSIEDGYTTYTSNKGLKELRQKISEVLAEEYNVEYSWEDEILITTGVSEGLDLALRALINPGEEVLIPQPCYVAYGPCALLAGAKVKIIPLSEDTRFKLTPTLLKEYISDKTKVIILSYPNNPTGTTYTKEELSQLVDILANFNTVIITDEIYHHFTYDMSHTSLVSFPSIRERVVLLDGFSKAYAMTGWRIGYAVANKEIIEAMTKIHQYTMLCAPTICQFAAIEALDNGRTSIEYMKEEYKKRRNLITKQLNDIGLKCDLPDGAFYVFCSIKETNISSKEFARKLFLSKKVAVVPGDAFGQAGEGYIRLSYATSMTQIKKGIERIEDFLKSI